MLTRQGVIGTNAGTMLTEQGVMLTRQSTTPTCKGTASAANGPILTSRGTTPTTKGTTLIAKGTALARVEKIEGQDEFSFRLPVAKQVQYGNLKIAFIIFKYLKQWTNEQPLS